MPDIPESPFFMENKILNFLVFLFPIPLKERNFSLHQPVPSCQIHPSHAPRNDKTFKNIQIFYYY